MDCGGLAMVTTASEVGFPEDCLLRRPPPVLLGDELNFIQPFIHSFVQWPHRGPTGCMYTVLCCSLLYSASIAHHHFIVPDLTTWFCPLFSDKKVFVVPAFESQAKVSPATTKQELVALWDAGTVQPFYHQVCWKCQKNTDYDKWKRWIA